MTISLAFLAPSLVKAAVDARLPRGIGVGRLFDAPVVWSRQHQMLGLARLRCEFREAPRPSPGIIAWLLVRVLPAPNSGSPAGVRSLLRGLPYGSLPRLVRLPVGCAVAVRAPITNDHARAARSALIVL
jgi:hypothetical protein